MGDAGLRAAALVAFVATRDLQRAASFYGGVLGLDELEPNAFARAFDAGGTPVRVTRVADHEAAAHTVLGWSVPDLEEAIDVLAGRGVEVLRYDGLEQDRRGIWTAPGGTRVAWFSDPDGNVLSLSHAP